MVSCVTLFKLMNIFMLPDIHFCFYLTGSTLRPTGDTILTILAAYVGLKAFLILILSILAAIYVNKNY